LVKTSQLGAADKEQKIASAISVSDRIEKFVSSLWQPGSQILSGPQSIDFVGHRVVHGGAEFPEAVRVIRKSKER
jgi:acetate kinase